MPKIDVVAHIHAGPGHEALFREALESFVDPTRKEKGCIRYDLFIDSTDASKFTFIEEWESLEDLQIHSQSEHILSGRARMAGKEASPTWVQVLHRIK